MNLKTQFGSFNQEQEHSDISLWKELSNYLLEKKIDQIRPEKQLPWQPMHQKIIDVLYPHLAS